MGIVTELHADPGTTVSLTSSDSAQAIPAGVLNASNKPAKRVWITVEDNTVRVGFGGAAISTSLGHLFYAGDIIKLDSYKQANEFRVISAVAGVHGVLQITGEY